MAKLMITYNGAIPHRCQTLLENNIPNHATLKVHRINSNEVKFTLGKWSAPVMVKKPVIYLYPKEETDVKVSIEPKGEFSAVYPAFTGNHEWSVHAYPCGKLTIGDRSYGSLFWEANCPEFKPTFDKGFIVEKSNAIQFLEEKLHALGLNDAEANEFITFWLPVLNTNERSIVSFQFENYEEQAPLTITPKPDSVLRVFLAIKKATTDETIEPQELPHFTRSGFSVVEWGGVSL